MKKIIVLIVIALSCGMLFGQKYSKKKDYSEGLAAVYFQERWGFVDENDKLVINYAFEDVRPFSNGVAQVKYQGNWIYIDKKGKVTNAPQIAQNNSSSSSNNKNSSSSSNKSSSSSNYNSSSNKNNPSNSSNKSSSSSSYNSSSSSSNNSSNSSSSSSNYQTSSNSSGNSNSSRQEQVGKYILFDDEPHTEKDGFCWIETSGKDMEAWNKGELRYVNGAKDKNGKVIIPLGDYDYVFYSNTDNDGYPPFFKVAKNECNGAFTIDGREIIAPKYGKVHYDPDSDVFVFQEYAADPTKSENFMTILFDDSPWYSLGISINKKGEISFSNKGIVASSDYYTPINTPPTNPQPSSSQERVFKQESDGYQWYLIKENDYEGAQDKYGNTIIPLSRHYRIVHYAGDKYGTPPYFSVVNSHGTGACSITGQEIIPPEYPSLIYDEGSFQYRTSFYEDYKSLGISLNSMGTEVYQSSSEGSILGALIVGVGVAIIAGISEGSSSSSSSSSNRSSGPEVGRRSYKNVEIVDVKYEDGTLLKCVSANVRIRNKNSYSVVVKVQCRFNKTKWDEGSYIEEVTIPAGEIRTVEILGPQRLSYYDTRIVNVY